MYSGRFKYHHAGIAFFEIVLNLLNGKSLIKFGVFPEFRNNIAASWKIGKKGIINDKAAVSGNNTRIGLSVLAAQKQMLSDRIRRKSRNNCNYIGSAKPYRRYLRTENNMLSSRNVSL